MNPNYNNPYVSNPNMYSQNKNPNTYPQQSNPNTYPQQSNPNTYPQQSNPYMSNPNQYNPNMSNPNQYNPNMSNPNQYNQNQNNRYNPNQNSYNPNQNQNPYQNPNPYNNNQNPYQNQNPYNNNQNNNPSMGMNSFARQLIMNFADGIFDKYDANRSGKLDVKEIYPATCELFQTNNLPCPSYQQVIYIMRQFDENGDGLIDKGEFRTLLMKLNGV